MDNLNNQSSGISSNFRTRDGVTGLTQNTPRHNNTQEGQDKLAEELVASLNAQVGQLQNKLSNALTDLEKANLAKSKSLADAEEMAKTISNRAIYEKGLVTRINKLTNENTLLTEKLKATDIPTHSEEHVQTVEQLVETQKMLAETKQSLTESRKEMRAISLKYNALVKQSNEVVKMVDQHEGLVASLDKAKKEASELQRMLDSERATFYEQKELLDAEIKALDSKLKTLKNKEDIDTAIQVKNNKALEDSMKVAYESKEQVELAQAQSKELQVELDATKVKLDEALVSLESLNELQSEKAILQSQLMEANEQVAQMSTKLEGYDEMVKQLEELKVANSQLAVTGTEEKSNFEAIAFELEQLKEAHANCKSPEEFSQMQLAMSQQQEQINLLRQQLSLTESEKQSLLNQINEMHKDGDPSMIAELNGKIKELEIMVATQNEQMNMLNDMCNKAEEIAKINETKASAFDDLVEFYGKVLSDIGNNDKQASDAFDKTAERYIMPYIHLLDLM